MGDDAAKSRGRVLVADDEPSVHLIMSQTLRKAGFEVEVARDGNAALELLRHHGPEIDVAVLDIMMPGHSGLDLVRWVRETYEHEAPRLLLASALGGADDIRAAFELGADDYVPKPLRITELRARVCRLAELRRAERELRAAHTQMQAEIECASRIQASLLPARPIQVPGITAAYGYEPCRGLAGDFLDVQRIGTEQVAFYVADVCGHGVASSLVATWATHAFSSSDAAAGASTLPSAVCRRMNAAFDAKGIDSYLTVSYCLLEPSSGRLVHCSAGHPAPILFRADGSVERLEAGGGPAVGMSFDLPFEDGHTRLDPGDTLFIFTDGLTELQVGDSMLGEERLVELLRDRLQAPLQDVIDDVLRHLLEGRDPPDDLTLLGIAM